MKRLARLFAGSDRHRTLPGLLRSTGLHEREIARQFNGRVAFAGAGPVIARPLVLVAFTNRCGSNLLCEYLRQSGKVAGGMEQLNHDVVARQRVAHPVDSFADHIAALAARHGPVDSSFCLKASWDQLLMLYRWNIPAMFSQTRIIHIQRQDAIAQAVSHSIAVQTQRWNSAQAGSGQAPAFLPDQIAQILADQRLANDAITLISQILGLGTVQVTYEQLIADPTPHLLRVLAFCGIEVAEWSVRPPTHQRQADGINADFAARFRAIWREALLPQAPGSPD